MFDFLIGVLEVIFIATLFSLVAFLIVRGFKTSVQQGGTGRQNSHNVNSGTQSATQSRTTTTLRHGLEWRKLLKPIGWIVLVGFVILLVMMSLPYLQNIWVKTPSPTFGGYLPEWIGGVANISPVIWIVVAIAVLALLTFERARSRGSIFFILVIVMTGFYWSRLDEVGKLSWVYQTSDYFPWNNQQTIILTDNALSEVVYAQNSMSTCIKKMWPEQMGYSVSFNGADLQWRPPEGATLRVPGITTTQQFKKDPKVPVAVLRVYFTPTYGGRPPGRPCGY